MEVDYLKYNLSNLTDNEDQEEDHIRLDDSGEVRGRMVELLEEAEACWINLEDLRRRRRRSRNFLRGFQWSDTIIDPDTGKETTEEEYILKQGKQPLVNNQIQQIFKNLVGQMIDNDYKPQARSRKREDAQVSEMMTNAIQYVYDANKLKKLDIAAFKEFMLSGVTCWKTGFDWLPDRNMDDVVEDLINTNYMFWNPETRDVRGKDITIVGEIIDAPLEQIVGTFSKNKEEAEIVRNWYRGYETNRSAYLFRQDSQREDSLDFRYPLDDNLCRYFEIWKLKYKEKVICHDLLNGNFYQHPMSVDEALDMVETENQQRLLNAYEQFATAGYLYESFEAFVMSDDGQSIPLIDTEIKIHEPVWCYYMVTPEGYVLDSGETPYEHESHPYTLMLYPLIDGEVWGMVEDIIDLQKGINRHDSMIDHVISSGAKGVLMIPEDVIPTGWNEADFAEQWTKHNGVIVYKPSKGHNKMPEQITSKAVPAGVMEMLQFKLAMIKEISGVTGAIQGQSPDSGTPASRYAMETANAAISSKDYFENFFGARRDRDEKIMKVIKQFYQEERHINVSGVDYSESAAVYKPELVSSIEFDLVIGKSANAPMFRMMIDETLKFLLESNRIDEVMFLENTSLPFADKLIQQIKEKRDAMQQQGLDPSQQNALPPDQMGSQHPGQ